MSNAGRIGKYNPEIVEAICKWISAGNTARDACALEDIGESTFYEWKEKHTEFAEAIKKAEAHCKARNIANIQKAGQKSWQASAWYLERKYKGEFAERKELTAKDGEPLLHSEKAKEVLAKYNDDL